MNLVDKLKRISNLLIKSSNIEEEIHAVKLLSVFYEDLIINITDNEYSKKDTDTKGGIALSPKHAKECVEDYIRTARFIKGIYKAINKLKEGFKKERIEILYAGCGPLGTLIIPILPLFKSSELTITLIDIHEASISSIKNIIDILEYQEYIDKCIVADAITYKHHKSNSIHLVVTETMDKALIKEPQVLITQNLAPQIKKEGVLIPEEIKLTTGYSFYAKEKKHGSRELDEYDYININRGEELFSITKKVFLLEDNCNYESDYFFLKENIEETPDICVFTEVVVFDDIIINSGESYITNPLCVKSIYTLKNEKFKLNYKIAEQPKWFLIE